MTREEAIDIVRNIYKTDKEKKALVVLIPELRESEDERIRSALLRGFNSMLANQPIGTFYGEPIKDIIAWLKKQKESLHISETCKENGDSFTDENERVRKEIRNFLIDMECKKEWIAYMEKQKVLTCQPRDWNDADERMSHPLFQEGFDVGREVGKIEAEQKPAEWSEEDKEALDMCLDVIPKRWKTKSGILLTKWLKDNIHLQSKQEWGENYNEENIQTRFAFYTYKDDPSTLYLSNVFVEEASRNHGFGTRILKAAEKVADTLGATTISLKVKRDSPAYDWYRKNGYGYVTFEGEYDWLEKTLKSI